MELLCLGLNHKTAPVEVRERFAVGTTKLGDVRQRTHRHDRRHRRGGDLHLQPHRVLSGGARRAGERFDRLEAHLAEKTDLHDSAAPHFYRMEKSDAARHLCRVVSGLDSMMLGETEIFGQVKQAYQAALEAGATAGVLNRVFQRAFGVGKKVRTETSIQEGSTSVGNVAVDLAEKIFGHLKNSEVMILGAGEMSRITAQSLVSRGARSIFVSNRSFDRAEELATDMGGTRRALRRLAERARTRGHRHFLHRFAPRHRPAAPMSKKPAAPASSGPLFFIDIAVPRDIDPAVGEIEEVYLYDIDTLEQLADEARAPRQKQIEECERIIDAELAKLNLPGT